MLRANYVNNSMHQFIAFCGEKSAVRTTNCRRVGCRVFLILPLKNRRLGQAAKEAVLLFPELCSNLPTHGNFQHQPSFENYSLLFFPQMRVSLFSKTATIDRLQKNSVQVCPQIIIVEIQKCF